MGLRDLLSVRKKPVMDGQAYLEKLASKGLTSDGGALIPDPTPIAPPVGYVRQPSITERIRDMVRSERLRAEVEAAGAETFEESEDFDVGDDFDPQSPYEEIFDPPIPDASTGGSAPPGGSGGGEGGVARSDNGSPVPAGAPGEAGNRSPASGSPSDSPPAGGAPTPSRSTSS